MAVARVGLLILGILMLLMGLLWMGQGTGVVAWPASSFMIDRMPWFWRGALLAGLGALVVALARRIRR